MGRRAAKVMGGAGLLALILVMVNWLAAYAGFGDPPLVVLDTEIEYYLQPDRSYQRFGNRVEINRYGMRSDDFEVERSSLGARRIFLFGDSVIYGNHFIDQGATVAAQLQVLLRQDKGSEESMVGAVAASSWGPENILAFYRRFGPFPGEQAVVVLSTHDMTDVPFESSDIIPYRVTGSINALHDLVVSVAEQISRVVAPGKKPIKYEDKRESVDASLQSLLQILVKDYPKVLLVFHPTKEEVMENHAMGEGYFREMAAQQGIGFVSLLEPYGRGYDHGVQVHADTIHLTPSGALLLSRMLFAHCCVRDSAED